MIPGAKSEGADCQDRPAARLNGGVSRQVKLAEALMERKAIKTRMEDLKKRIYQNAKIQEGDQPLEEPPVLLAELARETERFEALIVRINRTNKGVPAPGREDPGGQLAGGVDLTSGQGAGQRHIDSARSINDGTSHPIKAEERSSMVTY